MLQLPSQKYTATQYKILSKPTCSIAPEWQSKAEQAEQKSQARKEAATKYYNSTAHNFRVGLSLLCQHNFENSMAEIW